MNDFEQLLQMDREQLMKALAHKANTRRLLGIDGDNDVVKFEYHNAKYVYRQDGTIVMLDIYVEREDTELLIPADVDHVCIYAI